MKNSGTSTKKAVAKTTKAVAKASAAAEKTVVKAAVKTRPFDFYDITEKLRARF